MERINILVLDEPLVAELFRIKFEEAAPHYNVRLAHNISDCMRLVDQGGVDCIITDLRPVAGDNVCLLDNLRDKGARVPVIFVTGHGSEELARDAFKRGAFDYITKEAALEQFTRVVNSVSMAVRHTHALARRETAERALVEEKNKLEAILSSILDGVCIIDKDYNAVYCNEAYKRMSGTHIGELCYKAIQGRDDICEGCPVEKTYSDGGVHFYENVKKINGKDHIFEVSASPLIGADGEITAAVKVVRDVTSQRLEKRQKANLFAMIRNDIKTPLAIISGSAETLMSDRAGSLDEGSLGMLSVIQKSAVSLSQVIEDLITVNILENNRGSLRLEPVDLNDLLAEVVAGMTDMLKNRGISFTKKLGDGSPIIVSADRDSVAKAVTNMLAGAALHTASGGDVLLELTAVKRLASVSVKDTGGVAAPGSRTGILDKDLFSPNRWDSTSGGLCLVIAKAVAEAHGGGVKIQTLDDGGFTFTFQIPLA